MSDARDEAEIERDRLSEWPEHGAAPGFADGVMARLGTPPPRGRSRGAAVVGFAAGVVVASVAAWWSGRDGGASREVDPGPAQPTRASGAAAGELTATARTEVRLGEAAVAAVEAGAALSWQTRSGRVEVEQSRGRVFYRADGAMVVRTRWGELAVVGTSFSVDSSPARTELVVYEGAVAVTSGGRAAVVAGGHRITMTRRGLGPEQPAPWPGEATATAGDQATAARRADACDCEAEEIVFDPGAATLAAWAQECRLQFDVAPLGYDAGMLEPYLDELRLTTDERQVVRAAVAAVEARADQELMRLYADATGDEATTDRMSLDWMFSEVLRSADADEPAQVRRTLARERAGLQAAPADLSQVTPYEELVRSLMRSGDDFERALVDKLGARRGRELRAGNGGWPGLRWNVAGCPPE